MKRFFIEKLKDWKSKVNRKPLVLSGARQVGKTWLLKEFGRIAFKNTAYVNFDKNEELKAVFEGGFDFKVIISAIQAVCNVDIVPSETLIIFDEIQLCPNALRSLKYWQEDYPQYHIAAAGSLIGLSLMEGSGYPVGKTNSMTLYPMSFSEFLTASGDEKLSDLIVSGNAAVINVFHDTLSRRLKEYLFVGGMPAAVSAFVQNRSFAAARSEQMEILSDYGRDFGKHAPKEMLPRIRALWRSLPAQLAKEDKRFVAADVIGENGNKMRSRDLKDPFEWLEAAGIAYRVWNVTKPNVPLDSYRNHLFKFFGVDVGLLCAHSSLDVKSVVDGNRIFTEFKGALTEQFVQQELRAASALEPFFWSAPRSQAEIDFLVEADGMIVPIEVKAERNLKAKSLQVFRQKFQPALSVRTSLAEYEPQDGLLNLPLYAIGTFRSLHSSVREF
jgi:predicted AAA+ superfamily ATPase